MSSQWTVLARDVFGNRVGTVDDYSKLDMKCRFNDVSTWSMTLDRRSRMATELVKPGAGIIVFRDDDVFFSGLTMSTAQDVSVSSNTLTVSGESDTTWLRRRLASPQPATSGPPYAVSAEDARTGVASTIMQQFFLVNLGSSALPFRQAGITNAADPVLGTSLTGSGRWQPLLTLLQELAVASEAAGTILGFEIKENFTDGAPQFRIYGAQDLTASVIFSPERNNLAGFSYSDDAPTATYVFAGGDGEGTARTILERVSTLQVEWGRIEGDLVDARNAANNAEILQAADKALTDGAGTTSLSITPIDTDNQTFGTHYNLGDKVTVVLDPLGLPGEQQIGLAMGQGSSVTGGYIIVVDADAGAFSVGMRIRILNNNLSVKEPGTRTITGFNSAFGFTNIEFSPPCQAATNLGDFIQAFVPTNVDGQIVKDIIREVNITLDQNGEHIVPVIGNTSAKLRTTKIYTSIRAIAGRITNLERR